MKGLDYNVYAKAVTRDQGGLLLYKNRPTPFTKFTFRKNVIEWIFRGNIRQYKIRLFFGLRLILS